jgi:SSS family solute:Na+ symporter
VVFAAGLKLIIPFVIVIPGIISFNLYQGEMALEATRSNQPVIDRFEELRSDPGAAPVVFSFDEDFARLNPARAREIARFNAAVAGMELPEGPLHEANAVVLGLVAAQGGRGVEAATALIGRKYDSSFALLIKHLVPTGLRGFILAAILGAVMSSLASMLNAASTIFTMDLYRNYVHKAASQAELVKVGRICVGVFVAVGCLIAPLLDDPAFGGIFTYIQEFQGFISPGILAVFVFGLLVPRAPAICGTAGLILNPIVYGILKLLLPNLAFLDRMAVTFFCVLALMAVITWLKPLAEPVRMPVNTRIQLESSPLARNWGIAVVLATLGLYAFFW